MQRSEAGCLPGTNCLITVPQDKWFAVEMFGSFKSLHGPGLHFAGIDCFGSCVSLRSITSRVEQLRLSVSTKTKDNVFVNVVVAVQLSVNSDRAQDAFYKLTDVGPQVDSYVSDVVRSRIPSLNLDDAFEAKDQISDAVQVDLQSHMLEYGFTIHKALVIEIGVNADVMASMNEINKQARLRDASIMAAEAEKIKTVKAAEAEADAAQLAGEGIARQRSAIVEGLRSSISQVEGDITTEDISALLLATQYFETLKDIGAKDTCKSYFLPDEKAGDLDAQFRRGMLEGQAALEHMHMHNRGGGGGGGGQRYQPPQQSMSPPSPPPAARPSRKSSPSPAPQQFQQQQFQLPPQAPPPRQPQRLQIQIQIPPGVQPGQALQVQAPDGRVLQIQVPPGVGPGQTIAVEV